MKLLNQEFTNNEQIELLPYDPKWEFPIERLQLGNQWIFLNIKRWITKVTGKHLGCGHYGRVIQAKAHGIFGLGVATVVVKLVKSRTDKHALKSLVSELKVLMHLGSHLNIVSLLGAVTKNIVKGIHLFS